MTVYLSVAFAVLGLIVYLASGNPKTSEVGRITYFAGLLAFLLTGAAKLVEVLR